MLGKLPANVVMCIQTMTWMKRIALSRISKAPNRLISPMITCVISSLVIVKTVYTFDRLWLSAESLTLFTWNGIALSGIKSATVPEPHVMYSGIWTRIQRMCIVHCVSILNGSMPGSSRGYKPIIQAAKHTLPH